MLMSSFVLFFVFSQEGRTFLKCKSLMGCREPCRNAYSRLPRGVNRVMPRAFPIDLSSDQTCDNCASSAHTIENSDISRKLCLPEQSKKLFSINIFFQLFITAI